MSQDPEPAAPDDRRAEATYTGPSPARPHRWFEVGLFLLILLAVAARMADIEADAPYLIISDSGTFLSDEGWYAKSAQLHTKFGEWTNAVDLVWYSHNILFTVVLSWAFDIFGVSLVVARSVSIAGFVIALFAFYGICRAVQPRVIALAACLLVAVTLQTFAYSRLALIEPAGATLSLAALWFWVRFPRSFLGATGAVLCAGAAFLAKISFVFTGCAVFLLILGDAVVMYREHLRLRAVLHFVGTAVVGTILFYVVHRRVVDWSAADGALFEQWHVSGRAQDIHTVVRMAKSEVKMLYKLVFATGGAALVAVIAFSLVLLRVKGRLRLRLPWSRSTCALLLWGLGGCLFFGLFWYQPPRYFYFAIFPVAFAAVLLVRQVVRDRHWRLAALFLLLIHGTVQVPGYFQWLRRDDLHTTAKMARGIVAELRRAEPGDETLVLMGDTSSLVSLFDPRIRPIEFRSDHLFEQRVERWRPRFLLATDSTVPFVRERRGDLISAVEELASYEAMENYSLGENLKLYRLHYAK